jgi:hypothetical protein
MEYQGQHGHATDKVEEYGQPVAGHGGATGGPTGTHGAAAAAGTGQLQPTRDDHKTDGVLRRSGSSSSSSVSPRTDLPAAIYVESLDRSS